MQKSKSLLPEENHTQVEGIQNNIQNQIMMSLNEEEKKIIASQLGGYGIDVNQTNQPSNVVPPGHAGVQAQHQMTQHTIPQDQVLDPTLAPTS